MGTLETDGGTAMKSLLNLDVLRTNLSSVILILGLCIPIFSCNNDDNEEVNVPVESVVLSTSSLMLNVDETFQLTATLLPENATNQNVTWISSDEAIATVSNEGLVTAIATGNVTITAGVGNISAICTVTVRNEVVPDEPIVIEGEKASMNLDAFASTQDVVNAISEADKAGVKEYVLFGDFAKLGIGTDINPFKNSKAEIIDMSYVTGWPEVSADVLSRSGVLKSIPDNAFGRDESDPESPLRKVILPKSVEIVGKKAFCNCTKLAEVLMPGVLLVGEKSFSGCFDLALVDAPLLQTIGTRAFEDCDDWERVYLPSVRIVGEDAFYACDKKMKEIDLPEAVILCEDAFKDCAFLEKVNLPKAEIIGMEAFAYDFCETPAELVLPSVTTLDDGAFYDCEKLYRLSLPKVTTIGKSVFQNCYELTTLELTVSAPINTIDGTFDDFNTSACNLILNNNKEKEVNENTWKGVSWKSIAFD